MAYKTKLTPYQVIFYYEWLQNPQRNDYNIIIDNTGYGSFDLDRANTGLARLLNEHFILNSRVVNQDGQLYWEMKEPIKNPIKYFPNPLTDKEIYDLVSIPFDLSEDQLLRLYIINLGNNCFRQIIVVSHILVDGIGTQEIRERWSHLYNQVPYDKEAGSIEKQIELHDKLTQSFESNLEKSYEKIHDFWKDRLKDISGVDLNFLKSAKTISEDTPKRRNVSEYCFSYSDESYAKVKNLKYDYSITPYIFGQLVLAILLHKISGKDKLALAYPIAILEGQEMIYGAHVNTMVIDYRFDENKTLNDLIQAALKFYKQLKVTKAKYLPVYDIAKYADNAGVLSIGFAQTFFRDYGLGFDGLEDVSVNHEYQMDLVNELLFEQEDHNASLNYRIRYDGNLLDKDLVAQFLKLYEKLFEELLDDLVNKNGDRLISDVQLLTNDQENKIVGEWNANKDLSKISKTVVELVEERAGKTPDNIAVVFKNRQISYKELNETTNSYAAYLKTTYNIQPNDLIALYLDKSEFMPIAMLSILKAGGAYVPIDPDAPQDRILYMLKDTKASVVITSSQYAKKISDLLNDSSIQTFNISDKQLTRNIEESYSSANLVKQAGGDDLAYVIYTSGTTGKPKGVMLEHNGLANLALVQGEAFGLKNNFEKGNQKRCLWYASYIFDAHVSEVFTALANGHSLYVLEEESRLDFKLLSEYISVHKINVATIPPVLLDKNTLLDLSTLVVAGEVTNMEIMNNYKNKEVILINAYGPTEGTVCSSLHYYQAGDKNTNIGRPLCNMASYVLNSDMQPLPIGAVGELYIGGAGIARGYVNNPELTNDQFIANPFQSEEDKKDNYNSRLYKTGDLVRFLPNGDIEYFGRNDFQVKIRGFRIELGEIETRLSEFENIDQAVVIAKEHASGTKYLIAYYLSANELDSDAIKAYIGKYLPDYMVPSHLVHLSAFPMTVNGKLDRKALPEPQVTNQKNYVPPTNETEKFLCKIYGQVLGLADEEVGIYDDFFKLGGDSISSIQLVGRIRQQLQVQVDIKDIMELRTIHDLAIKLENNKQTATKVKSEQGLLEGESKFLPIQKWFLNNADRNIFKSYNHWNQTFMLNVPTLDIDILQQSICKLVEYHDALRFGYDKNADGSYTQYYQKEIKDIAFTSVDATALSQDEQNALFDKWQKGFNIFSSPLFHIGYLQYKGSAKLHFAFHHLIIDAISWHIIKNDLQTIYHYLSDNRDIDITTFKTHSLLGNKRTSYRQWVDVVSYYKGSSKEVDFWQAIIDNVAQNNLSVQDLSKDIKSQYSTTMDVSYTEKMLRNIHHVYNTKINDILLTALSYALKKLSGSDTHYVTLEGHGREEISNQIDINSTVGWFTSMYPIELNCNAEHTDKCLVAIKDMLNSIPNKGLGYGALFGYTENQLPKIGFNYLGQFDSNAKENDWAFSSEYTGLAIAADNEDSNTISINCGIIDNEFRISVNGALDESTLSAFTENYIYQLKDIIDTLSVQERSYLTHSDVDGIVSDENLQAIQAKHEIEGIYMANSLQQGFVYHAISQGDIDDAYRTQMLWDYHNHLDVELLKQAWSYAQKKYPSLRLRFSWDDEIVQIIDKEGVLNWNYIDISDKKPDEQDKFVESLLAKDRHTAYDLQKGSLFRIYLIKREDQSYNCIFSSHHAILDGWSNPVLIKYVHEVYLALLHQQHVDIVEDKEYALSQKYLQDNKDKHIHYWTEYLKHLESQEDLSNLFIAEKKNINLSEYKLIEKWNSRKLTISGDDYTKIKQASSTYGITLNALLQYCWHKQLSIYTASESTIVGMVVASRNLPIANIEQSVGLFINTLPVICLHNGELSVIDQVKGLQNAINEGNHCSNINLSQLQSDGNRLFNSLFVFENYPMPEGALGEELSIQFKEAVEKQDYPLVVTVFEQNNELTLNLQYAEGLFEKSIMEQIVKDIPILLSQVLDTPETKVSQLSYLDSAQYNKMIVDWNNTRVPCHEGETVISLFEKQVEKTPENLAVRYNDVTLSYKKLNEKANQLAAYIKQKYEICPDDLIGLYLDRSEHILISILAVLKTGAAYLPVDPSMPDDRVSYMFSDAKVKCVLANEIYRKTISKLEYQTHIEAIDSKELLTLLKTCPAENQQIETTSQNLAYVMYTSGTTGMPKGVMIEHRHINSLIFNSNYVSIDANDSILSLSGYQFDGSTYDFYAALLNGASVTISTKDVFLNLNEFNNIIEKYNITNIFVTTALFNMLVDAELPNLKQLKYLLFGGELVSALHVNRFNQIYNNVNLVHVYGPTETTTYATGYLTNKHKGEFVNNVPIGYALQNTSLYVLDHFHRPVPVGALGELYIGGSGLSRGYLNNPDQTLERFIVNPFQTSLEISLDYNSRLYKTGDLVRYNTEGSLEYIGRNDFQVKIRGFRIELGEIESQLNQHPDINQSLVIAYDHSGVKHLAAYYQASSPVDEDALRTHLSSHLPDYMVPEHFIHLVQFPLTINGKIDRRALPQPQFATDSSTYVAPGSPTEKKLCTLYSTVLDLSCDTISIEDDFFRLGGNSILAIKLAGRINKTFGQDIHISSIFTHRTIRSLSSYLDSGDIHSVKITPQQVACVQDQQLSFAQERLWFIETYEEGSNAYNVPMTFRLEPKVDLRILYQAIESIVERHEVLRSRILTNSEGIGYQQVLTLDQHPLLMQAHTYSSLSAMEQSLKKTINRVFQLDEEYPIHVEVYEYDGNRYISIVVHHIAFDGWSIDLLIHELRTYYAYHTLLAQGQDIQAREHQLAPLPIQYKDYALWQRSYLQGATLDTYQQFWHNQLLGYQSLNLLTDYTRPAHIDYRGHDILFSFDADTSQELRELAKALNVSLYSVFLSGYYLLLSSFSNQDDIVVGTPVAGRNYQELQDIIGFFVNMLALRQQIDTHQTLKDFIQGIGDQVTQAQLHQDLPFEKLVESLQVEKDPSRHPIFQVIFAMQSFGGDLSNLNHLLTPYRLSTTEQYEAAKYDLTMMLDDSGFAIKGVLNYASSLFKPETIQQYISVYTHIMTQLVAKVDQPLSHINYLDSEKYTQQIVENNRTRRLYPKDATIIDMFENQVQKTPDNIAVIYQDIQLSYRQLDERATRLAAYLIDTYQIGSEDIVGLCLDRSEHMLIAILAVLKAGGAYAPMDPAAPADRLLYMVADTRTKVVLSGLNHSQFLKELLPVSIESIDCPEFESHLSAHYGSSIINRTSSPESLAYVIYTSGTTGNPKGVMVQNGGVVNFIVSLSDKLNTPWLTKGIPQLNYMWYSNYIFDAHVIELYPTILTGNILHVLSEDKRYDLELINQYINQNNIDFTFLPPAILNKDFILNLKQLGVGGESTNLEIMNNYRSKGVKVINAYGPTETTVAATVNIFELGDLNANLGRPLANTSVYVLDANLRPLPIGAIGELYVGGDGVARGYLNNEELTNERFIANPFQTQEEKEAGYNSRIYKTGDLVTCLDNGDLIYLGRNDFQVKIRGYRIELGEIESRLNEIDKVQQAVVLALSHPSGTKYLVGYYVSDTELDVNDIRSYLLGVLPDYMVPSVFVHLKALPMTAQGKLNRRALPTPELSEKQNYIAPSNHIEKVLCDIFAEVLNLEVSAIGINDDFFKMGGDSISSIQLVNRLRKRLNAQLSVKDIFNLSIIKDLSACIARQSEENIVQVLSEQGALSGELNLLPIQEWFFDNVDKNVLSAYNHWNQAFVIKVPKLNKDILAISLKKLVEYHDGFRICYKKANNAYSQYYKERIEQLPYDCADVTGYDTTQIEELFTAWQSGFNIFDEKLFHIGYLDGYPDGSARLHFALHHLIVDAVSWRIIQNDICSIYQYFEKNEGVSFDTPVEEILGEKRTSYRQWTEKLSVYRNVDSKAYAPQAEYWQSVVSDIAAGNEALSHLKSENIAQSRLILDKSTTSSLLREIQTVYNTQINDILLTALSFALSDVTKQPYHYVLLEGHGREDVFDDIDINNTVGWFTTMYPVKLETESSNIKQALPYIKDALRKIPDNGLGYGALMGYVQQELPIISFNYLGQFDGNNNGFWSFSPESPGKLVAEGNNTNKFLSINGGVLEGQLQLSIESFLDGEQTEAFAQSFKQHLETLVTELVNENRSYLTLSDASYLISKNNLDKLQQDKEVAGIYLANSLQEGFIYHAISQKGDDAYVTQMQWDYHASINVEKLKEAWKLAQIKYPSLRLRFSWEEELLQIIDKEGDLTWNYSDITDKTPEKQDTIVTELLAKDCSTPYNLQEGNLFRVYIIKRSSDRYSCIFSNHHAILDGWSGPLLLEFIHTSYLNLLAEKPVLTELDNCYASAQKYLQDHRADNLRFWKDYLQLIDSHEDLKALLKPEMKEINLSEYRVVKQPSEMILNISGTEYKGLKEMCRNCGFTINALLQYCWHKQLNIYGGTDTTVIGMTMAGRSIPVEGIEESVGLYINTLPVILDHKDEKVVDTLRTLQGYINEINGRSDVSLSQLHENGSRLFNSLFVFENYPVSSQNGSDADLLKIQFKYSREKLDYPLGISAHETEDEAVFKILYAGELFDADVIQQLLDGVDTILGQLADNPEIYSKDLVLLSPNEYEKVVYQWNNTYKTFDQEKTFVQIFEQQVEKTPDNIAAVFKDKRFTYRQLNERANALGAYLKETYSILPDDKIALCLDKSEYMLISILAVLKAGGAYVPINPEAPTERFTFMIGDTEAKVVLTNEDKLNNVSSVLAKTKIDVLAIDNAELLEVVASYPVGNFRIETTSQNLVYIIYTSGTTGIPKGVMLEHRGLVNMCTMQTDKTGLYACDKESRPKNCLWYASYVFDAHAFEIYNAIANGHCIHILEESARLNINELREYIREQKVEFASIPPALLDKDELLELDTLIVAGEVTSLETMVNYRKNGVGIINAYGPTEDTVWSTCHFFEIGDSNTNIGLPIHNTSLYVLDHFHRPVPVGALGELYIGGSGLSRGYLNNPDQTLERFIVNPFQTEQEAALDYNSRLYKTGDLVRYNTDGSLEYIGRNDFQVKIRGFRIELGEIESQLNQHPDINQSLVIAYDHSGVKHLAAYYQASSPVDEDALRTHLSSHLPDYMVPDHLIHLVQFPLTINGKIDRRALPQPQFATDSSTYVAPGSPTEKKLCTLYSTVLDLSCDTISIEDDFFRLGGNSILAIKLVGRINKTFGQDIHISSIFTHRTIRSLSSYLDSGDIHSVKITPQQVACVQDQQLSFAQERLWFIETYEEGSNAYNIPMVFKLHKKVDIRILYQAIESIVERHEVLRSLIHTNQDGIGYQQPLNLDESPLAVHIDTYTSKQAMEEAIAQTSSRIFHLDQEYPIHLQAYQLDDDCYISIVVHHIAFDGWSTDLLIQELHRYYTYHLLLSQGENIRAREHLLPPLAIQYKDYALWQRNYLQGEVLSDYHQFWREQLDGYESLNLLTDHVRPSHLDYRGRDHVFALDADTSQKLRELAKTLNVSLYSVFLSGYYLLLSSFSNQDDIVIGTPVAGRNYQEIQDTIGFFVNMLALRRHIKADISVEEFIQDTGDQITQAQLHQDLPFEKLVESLQVENDPSRHPIFQVIFGMQSFGSDLSSLSHLLSPYQLSSGNDYQSAKYDLTMMMDDSEPTIKGMLNYATSLFEESTITEYLSVYKRIMSQLVEKIDQPLSCISYLDQEKYTQQIVDNNRTCHLYPKDATIIDMFENQVQKTPDNIAVIYQDIQLSYRQLDERATRLAAYLIDTYQIGSEDIVGLCLDRSEHMLIAILAILKAGGAYAPMDPAAPADRLLYMVEDTRTKVVLSGLNHSQFLKELLPVSVESLDCPEFESHLSAHYGSSIINRTSSPESLAYVIYTSGTTGNPKGVMVQNGSVVNRINWMNEMYPITEDDRILQKTTYTFDVSVWELFWANWYGACIVLAHHENFKDNSYLCELIKEQHVTVMHFVPSMLIAFVEGLETSKELQDQVQGLKYLFCSGEALNLYEVRKFHTLVPNCAIHNLYGPTEATVDVLYYDCTDKDISKVLIGKPIYNTSAYVLSRDKQPLPVGAIGELYVGGDGVARGYLNNEQLTNERFVSNPFQTQEEKEAGYNDRIYKTGDLVVYRDGGDIEYIGRNDFQVKIRGFRIELGEIEARLCEIENVRQAVVTVLDLSSDSKVLVGYYVSDLAVDESIIQNHLANHLPQYMIPSVFVHLQNLPVNKNGKLDRKALIKPQLVNHNVYVAPKTETEHILIDIISDILSIEASQISMEDDFFKIGGNSISAIRLSFKICEAFDIRIRLIDILDARKISKLAQIIHQYNDEFNSIVKLNDSQAKDVLFMVHPSMTGCDIYTPFAQKLAPFYQCYGVDSYNFYNDDKISNLQDLAGYYLSHMLKTKVNQDKYALFGWSFGGQIALEIAAQLENMGKRDITVYLLDTWVIEGGFGAARDSSMTEIMDEYNIPDDARERVKGVIETENIISAQSLSSKLKYTKIILFKAMKNNGHELFYKYPKNNIDKQAKSDSQLQIVEIDTTHQNIITSNQVITELILFSKQLV